ncbi:MAG: alginate export family protein [Pseudomonadota bacterium]
MIKGHFQAGINTVGEGDLFWDLADIFAASADYDPDKGWIEYYLKPGISFEYGLPDDANLYGKVSIVASYTQNNDAYDFGDNGRVTLEEGYLGYFRQFNEAWEIDVSAGPREARFGTGMLIANGGSSGFDRGALKFGPRKAWDMAVLARLGFEDWMSTAFYLDPNEIPDTDNKNRLAGYDLRYNSPAGGYVGGTYAYVLNSDNAYPKAAPGGIGPPTVIPGAREGLNVINLYARTNPIASEYGSSFVSVDAAWEWNSNYAMQAWAGRFQAGHTWTQRPWTPSLTYTYKTFSGDDPKTQRQERFDPLYYDGSPSTWATGSKSSMTFINSNVQAQELAMSVKPTVKDTWTLRYAHIRANELRSPIQFGQATRFEIAGGDNIVAGVTDPHLADDFFLEYNRIINPNTFLNLGVSASIPGTGLDQAAGRDLPVWYGGFVNVVINY